MPVFSLHKDALWFPTAEAMEFDIVATGGDLRIERLLLAYRQGIFPWYDQPTQIQWWCPAERCVLYTDAFHVSHSFRNTLNRGHFHFSFDRDFTAVIEACREGIRKHQTWIWDEMVAAYIALHKSGFAHSVEVWENGRLAGGLYGVSLGHIFFGESMFSRSRDASKAALFFLSQTLKKKGWKIIDCQLYNPHLATLGATVISRSQFLVELEQALQYPTCQGNWENLFPKR